MTANSSGPPHLRLDADGPFCWIIAENPPRLNAFTRAMWAAMPALIARAEADPDVRVILLRGAGTVAFSPGADISEFAETRVGAAARDYDRINDEAFQAVAACRKPTIAMIHGYCMGGALELAMCCDLRYAADGAQFAIPAGKLGLGYNPRWIRPMLSVMSPSRAKEILFTGGRFSSEDALRMGIVNRLFPPADLERETRAIAEAIATNAPLSILAAKQAVDEFAARPESADLDRLDALVEACFESEDYREGVAAFLEKRKPVFKGR